MNEPNALRLAKWLDAMPSSGYALTNQAANELRRLHEEVNEQARLLGMSAERELALLAEIDKLERQLVEAVWNYGKKDRISQELLDALKELVAQHEASFFTAQVSGAAMTNARASIAKATGEQV